MKVFISGCGVISSLGNSENEMFHSLLEDRSAVQYMPTWERVNGLNSRLGAPAKPYDISCFSRTARRTMSRMSEMAALATQQALQQANLDVRESDCTRGALSMGSTTGSPVGLEEYFQTFHKSQGLNGQQGTTFFKVMNHSVASNVAVAVGFTGAVSSPSAACATSSMAAIMGWELLQSGLYDFVICGGADELHFLSAGIFDGVFAASRGYNDRPDQSPRPFEKDRDGLVVSEGAGVIVLETEAHLKKRGGKAIAEFCGGAYLCESSHMSQNNEHQMANVMNLALKRAGFPATEVGYINAHATGTLQGDAAESRAIAKVFGDHVPVSSLKGHFGHSMAACGVIEVVATLKMMESQTLIGTRNLKEIAPDCSSIMHLARNTKKAVDVALSNNFAFGGINTSIILRKTLEENK